MLDKNIINNIEIMREKTTNLVKRYVDDYENEEKKEYFIRRVSLVLLRNNCTTLRDIYNHEGSFKGAGKGTQCFKIIEKMIKDYESIEFKKKRLEEIDYEIRKLSEERKAILNELES